MADTGTKPDIRYKGIRSDWIRIMEGSVDLLGVSYGTLYGRYRYTAGYPVQGDPV